MSFADLSTAGLATALLQRSLERGRLGHAYLFTGGALADLEQTARTLAKTLNCGAPPRRALSGAAVDCCDQCLSCRKIDSGTHADIQWVRPESKTRVVTIDQMRELMHTVHLKPTEAAYKVAVIVAADRLNVQAANAFLKTLEEPPAKSVLVLLSTEPQRLLETVLSRCLRLSLGGDWGRPPGTGQAAWLRSFSAAAAGPRNLLGRYRLLGILLGELGGLRKRLEEDLAAKSPLETYEDVDPRLKERWKDELTAAIEAEYRRQRTEVLAAVEWWLRDIWLLSLNLGAEHLSCPELASASRIVASRLAPQEAVENLRVFERTQWLLGSNVQEALALEVGLLKLAL